ncbi:MAG: beta-ketoacyl synthase chain length factor [Geminicoccales bacterium]
MTGLRTGGWQSDALLQPARIAPRERRRAPKAVRMAIEVMSQACAMAGREPASVATVFSSAMGDMQITDYMCSALAATPREISPTRFHNSVHNAPSGYWSIATGSYAPASAVSAYRYTAPMALLEAAIQVLEENLPVLLVTQEMAAPPALKDTCPSDLDFAAALLLAPPGPAADPLASLGFEVRDGISDWPALPPNLAQDFAEHPGARLLPLLAGVAGIAARGAGAPIRMSYPLSAGSSVDLEVRTGTTGG